MEDPSSFIFLFFTLLCVCVGGEVKMGDFNPAVMFPHTSTYSAIWRFSAESALVLNKALGTLYSAQSSFIASPSYFIEAIKICSDYTVH